ncbi:MAG: hypothetical protein LC118_16445 [Dehalococcoidia bacterium]|nr:hypothetical protein [Dehalococcoidia bacterium]
MAVCFLGHQITGCALSAAPPIGGLAAFVSTSFRPPLLTRKMLDDAHEAVKTQPYPLKDAWQRVQITGPKVERTTAGAGTFLSVLTKELDAIKRDTKRDLERTIFATKETRMDYRTSAAELLELVKAGLLTKEEGRIIALDMFPTLKQKIAEKAYADAARLPE